jgi:MFS transporter, DHA1 family, multidrug resistance protein
MQKDRLGQTEFIALIAMLFATVAFSIDAMLPALPAIARELSPGSPNSAQLVITSFVLGMGIGTLFAGPISDAFGRKPVIVGGVVLYSMGAGLAWAAQSLEMLLVARVIQGLGVAAPRIVTMALVRDLYAGRQMASIMSFTMMIFTLVPAAAPALGMVIIADFGWRGVFAAFVLFASIIVVWLGLRQPETLAFGRRRPLRLGLLRNAAVEVFGNRTVVLCIAVLTLGFGVLFGTLSSTQQIFEVTFHRADSFPYWFAFIALLAGTASLLNARLVVRLGMRHMITTTLLCVLLYTMCVLGLVSIGILPDWLYFPVYLSWTISIFFMAGMVFGNLNALALEPLGHIAGIASSIVMAISTVLAVLIAAPLGLMFDGTPLPLMTGVGILIALAYGLMRMMPKAAAP